MKTLAEKAKVIDIQSRKTSSKDRGTKLPREEYIEVALDYLKGEISLRQIQMAGKYKINDVNSAYRIVAIGCRMAVEDGLLEVVKGEDKLIDYVDEDWS